MNIIFNLIIKDQITEENYDGDYYEYFVCVGQMDLLRIKPKIRFLNKKFLIFLEKKQIIRKAYHFKNVTLLIDPRTFTNNSFTDFVLKNLIGYKPVIVNQIIYGFDE